MRLLQELYTEEAAVLEEGVGADKKLYLEGISIQTNIPNKNKRIYPKEHVKDEINRYITEVVNGNSGWAEGDHPNGPQINIDRVAGRYVSLREDGDNYIGKMLITNTPMGNIVKGLIESGGKIGTSTRALGSVKKLPSGLNEVARDFRLITCGDIVLNPSAPDAYSQALMESKDWIFDNATGLWHESCAYKHKSLLANASTNQLDQIKFNIFSEFIDAVSKK